MPYVYLINNRPTNKYMYTKNSDIGNHYSLYFHPALFGDKLNYTKFSTHTPTTHVSERPPVKRSMSLTSSYTSASAVFISGVKSSRLLKLLATVKPQSPLYLIYDGMPENKFGRHKYLLCRTTVGRQFTHAMSVNKITQSRTSSQLITILIRVSSQCVTGYVALGTGMNHM